jgi:hypothetical protein
LVIEIDELYPFVLEIDASDYDTAIDKVIPYNLSLELKWSGKADNLSLLYMRNISSVED